MNRQTNRPEEELGGEDKGTLELANAISWVWLYLPLHLPFTDGAYCGYLVIQPFSPWPSTNKYKLPNLYRGLSFDYLHHFLFFPDPSFTRCWPNKDINISLHPGSNLWGADSLKGGNRKRVLPATGLSAPRTGHTVCPYKRCRRVAVSTTSYRTVYLVIHSAS